jgi:hypothetical protein
MGGAWLRLAGAQTDLMAGEWRGLPNMGLDVPGACSFGFSKRSLPSRIIVTENIFWTRPLFPHPQLCAVIDKRLFRHCLAYCKSATYAVEVQLPTRTALGNYQNAYHMLAPELGRT